MRIYINMTVEDKDGAKAAIRLYLRASTVHISD